MDLTKRLKTQLMRPCASDDQLHDWLNLFLGVRVPRVPICAGHCAPFDYLRRAYFEPAVDLVVWAPRGGGKTRLAAAATLLDLLHKPGCAVRILGGSLTQSLRMWEHLLPDIERVAERELFGRAGAARRLHLRNGSSAAVLTQSQRAVRGLRVQKLRCDEVEMFDPDIWEAAQLVTRSIEDQTQRPANGAAKKKRPKDAAQPISGAIEAISTLHKPYGLMQRIVDQAQARRTPVLRWCILEVLSRCPAERDCAACPLWDDCKGVAKTRCDGFVSIDDAIGFKQRVSRETWDAEMLCLRPSTRGCVFPRFDVDVHVSEADAPSGALSLAIDFGFNNPFVCLWIVTDAPSSRTWVIDEYVQEGRTVHEHLEVIEARRWGRRAAHVACDPAGQGRSDQTATSNTQVLRRAGYAVRCRKSLIADGIELIRAALCPAHGEPTLLIHPRCARLIRAMQSYRYPATGGELPLKDGTHDHLVDALRYHFVNRSGGRVEGRRY